MKKGSMSVILVIGAILLLAVLWGVRVNNNLVNWDEQVKQAFSNVQTQMQRRADLIPNYVETVKGYAAHESEVLIEVTKARSELNDALSASSPENPNTEAVRAANEKLSVSIRAVAEAYPELKANQNFMALQDELAGAENRIATARKNYNETLQQYNRVVRSFPSSIIAKMRGFEEKAYFEADPGATEVPSVNF